MQVLAIINQKGGVGKTSTVQGIGQGLTLKGYKVLYVDLDAQGNLSYTLGADATGLAGRSALEVLEGSSTAAEAIQTTAGGSIIASSPALAGADTILTAIGKEYRLKEALEGIAGRYDFVLIDTPPALGILTVNALAACKGCIIPAQADVYSLQGIGQLKTTLETVKRYCNPSLEVFGIVLTRWSKRALLNRQVAEMLQQTASDLNSKLYGSMIRECISLREAQAVKQDIYSYAPKSNAASDYQALVEELLAQLKEEA